MPHHIGFIVEETASAAALETRLNELRLIKRDPFFFMGTTLVVLEETHFKFGESSDQLDLSNYGLTVTGRASLLGTFMTFSNMSKKSGKWYCELRYNNSVSNVMAFGVVGFGHEVFESYPGDSADSYGYWAYDGKKYTDDVGSTYGSFVYTDDVLMMALDMDNGEIYWGSNGVWFDSGDPATRTNPAYTGLSGYKFVAVSLGEPLSKVTAAFGPTFKYTAPSGFLPFQA